LFLPSASWPQVSALSVVPETNRWSFYGLSLTEGTKNSRCGFVGKDDVWQLLFVPNALLPEQHLQR